MNEKQAELETKDEIKIRVLASGLQANDLLPLKDLLSTCDIQYLPADLNRLIKPLKEEPAFILCGKAIKGAPLDELGQLVRYAYRDVPIFLLCLSKEEFDHSYLMGMGYNEVFLSPIDWGLVKKSLTETLAKVTDGKIKSYHPVKIVDIKPGTILPFDTFIYFPANDRYVLYTKKDDPLEQKQADQLSKHQISTVFIKSENLQDFYAYSKAWMNANPGHPECVSATKKKENLRAAVRKFYLDFFKASAVHDAESGEKMTQELKALAQEILLFGNEGQWYLPLLDWTGEAFDPYARASKIALYASLLSARTRIGKPEEMAIAGLLQDCGLTNVPSKILEKKRETWTPEEQKLYQRHPEFSLSLIKNRKLKLSEKTLKMIQQQHECENGAGYPHGLSGDAVCREAQLLSLIDRIEDEITLQPGKKQVTPYSALRNFYDGLLKSEKNRVLSPELTRIVLAVFPESQK